MPLAQIVVGALVACALAYPIVVVLAARRLKGAARPNRIAPSPVRTGRTPAS